MSQKTQIHAVIPHSISSFPPWSSHTGNLYFCGFSCLLLPYFLLSRLTGPLCNIWEYQEAYQFLTKPTQLLQRLASIANLLEVKENCKIMKHKKFWSTIKGKHLEKLHLSTDSTGTLWGTLIMLKALYQVKRRKQNNPDTSFFCERNWLHQILIYCQNQINFRK